MRTLLFICRIVLGATFVFSGFVKAIDPLGSAYKFTDYFMAFGLDSFQHISFLLSIILSSTEFIIGLFLIFNFFPKLTSSIAMMFMSVFTPLTLYLAFANPVSDCGCFGDAWVLSNWETFYKNLFLLVLTLIIFGFRKKYYKNVEAFQLIYAFLAYIFIFSCSYYSYKHLPIIDFRPYHIGANISEGMEIPEGMPVDEYDTVLKYSKDGVVKEFKEDNYPWNDSTWVFVSMDQKLIKEGYKPPIHDFAISNSTHGDITQDVLNDDSYVLLFISKDLTKIKERQAIRLNELYQYGREKYWRVIGVTTSSEDQIRSLKEKYSLDLDFYSMDEIQVKTIVRANPAYVLLRKGTVINKWAADDLPQLDELNKSDLLAYSLDSMREKNGRNTIMLLLCFCIIGIVILVSIGLRPKKIS
ncbi:MAG: DoxX family membrane protein [Marinifilaceae bacterium]|jgi:peroxiredoxin/uncharacterized membrane protein YphA (DoxX/SURF4 family)|nr:DoxX family membrane protein [Marinifilaceae bacterium]